MKSRLCITGAEYEFNTINASGYYMELIHCQYFAAFKNSISAALDRASERVNPQPVAF